MNLGELQEQDPILKSIWREQLDGNRIQVLPLAESTMFVFVEYVSNFLRDGLLVVAVDRRRTRLNDPIESSATPRGHFALSGETLGDNVSMTIRSATAWAISTVVFLLGWQLLISATWHGLAMWHKASAIWFTILGNRYTWGARDTITAKLGPLASWVLVIEFVTVGLLSFVAALILRRSVLVQRWVEPSMPGLCPQCKYDLRGTSGRCPECGWESPNNGQPLTPDVHNGK